MFTLITNYKHQSIVIKTIINNDRTKTVDICKAITKLKIEFTVFALFRRECRSAQVNEITIDFFPRIGPICTISNTSDSERKLCL